MTNKEIIVIKELDFTVVATKESHHVSFLIYEIRDIYEIDGSEVITYGDFDTTDLNDPKLEEDISGHVKWDKCSNWVVGEHCMFHSCSREQLENVSKVMTFCFDYAAKNLETWIDKI